METDSAPVPVFGGGAWNASSVHGGPGRVPGSDRRGKCLYSIDDNIVRLCCRGIGSCSPSGWSGHEPLNCYEGPRFALSLIGVGNVCISGYSMPFRQICLHPRCVDGGCTVGLRCLRFGSRCGVSIYAKSRKYLSSHGDVRYRDIRDIFPHE